MGSKRFIQRGLRFVQILGLSSKKVNKPLVIPVPRAGQKHGFFRENTR